MRIEPLEEAEWDADMKAASDKLRPRPSTGQAESRAPTIRTWHPDQLPKAVWLDVLLRHPELIITWMPFMTFFVNEAQIPPRERELATLRVAWRCGGQFEWKAHTIMSRGVGVSPEDIERVRVGPEAKGWSDIERALLRAVDELYETASITDSTWEALATHWSDQQLIELPLMVGQYVTHIYVLNSIGIEVPDWDEKVV